MGFGAGGHAKVMIEAMRLRRYEIVALTDPNPSLWKTMVSGVPVVGDDSSWASLLDQGLRAAFIGLGSVGDSSRRSDLFERAQAAGFEIVGVIHPAAIVSSTASLGLGVAVMAGAIINAHAKVGDNVIINTGAIVEHDCVVGNHVHIATGARLASTVTVGDGAHVGVGATVRQRITIGPRAVVGAGAAVVKDVPEGVIVVGVPAVPILSRSTVG